MIDRVYIQKRNGEFINDTAYAFWYGCYQLGIETHSFTKDEFKYLDLREDTLVHGYISVVREAFTRIGVKQPTLDEGPPDEIRPFYGRNMWTTTMKFVRERLGEGHRIFIKPLRQHKIFDGHVTSGAIRDLIRTAGIPDEVEVLASDPVEFISEYRLFIHNGMIMGARPYRGDFTQPIDFQVVYQILEAYKSQPVGFSLDMGLTKDGRTLPVEVNDAFALGCYGHPAVLYAQMVIDRWQQIVSVKEPT